MGSLQLMNSYGLASPSVSCNFIHTSKSHRTLKASKHLSLSRGKIRAVGTIPESELEAVASEEPPSVNLAFVGARPLLNCGGGGTCGTCIVEVVQGKELLSPRTDKEKEKLKRNPKTWRLACQTTVGKADSRGLLIIQQLPEWKAHEWKYEEVELPLET
ncbi:hypothetical protein L1049_025276 [Liquidambar formosana]|uniref:2Fe-2S ferredoxin-type domain-containing protein n=1 Tax=Liquidambar formosana TaxID=63359 RepID=A0AAP0R3T7_LIQFO